jgi:hypothetical protein
MDWLRNLSNYNELPERKVWVSIQFGKAGFYSDHSAFAERDRVLVFDTLERAQHFIDNWDNKTMNNYSDACIKDDYTYWVILITPKGYYADYIRMFKDNK